MEEMPTLYTLPPSSRTRIYPHRPAFRTYLKAPCNSPASSTISSQISSVTGYDRKQRRVRFADYEASAESASQTETVLRTYYSVIQERSSSPYVTTGISSTPISPELSVQYSNERETCQVVQSGPASTVLPNTRPVVVQIDDSDPNKDTKNTCNDRIFVEHSQKSSTKKAYVLGIQSKMKCFSCLKSYLLISVATRRGDQTEIVESNSTTKSPFFYKEIGLSRLHVHCPVSSPGCRAFCKTVSWLTTAAGLASYAYMLLLAFSSSAQLVEQKYLFPFAVAISNICLGVALFCNCIL